MQNFWVTKKSIMLCYGIFWSGQLNVFFFYIGKLDCSLHHCGDCRKLLVGSHISGLSCCKRGRFRIRRDYSLPILAYTVYGGGGAPPERGTFVILQVNERIGKRDNKGQQMHFIAVKKSRKRSDFVIYAYFC